MNEDLNDLHYSPILNFNYAQRFQEIQYNGNTLTESERKDFVKVIDETIADYSEGLPMMQVILEDTKDRHDFYSEVEQKVVSVMLFVLLTMIDNMVACKYFLLADKDYDRRFMRGKLLVILNEGFKNLYGFGKSPSKKSQWGQLSPLMFYFPVEIKRQYQVLSNLLESQSKSSSWWKDERDLETHLDAVGLYKSRQEEIIESKVMMDSTKLFNALLAVNDFLTNVQACLFNYLVEQYHRGNIKE